MNRATEYSTLLNKTDHQRQRGDLRKILRTRVNMESSLKELAPFERLPNEVLLMIIEMAMDDITCDRRHNFLTDVIGNVSSRFSNLPAYPPLWKGRVFLSLGTPLEKDRERKLNSLGEGVESLCLTSPPHNNSIDRNECPHQHCSHSLSAQDLTIIAKRCPKLRHLSISGFDMKLWPAFETPCSVEFLQLCRINVDSDTFADSALHVGLPKIKVIELNECKGPSGGTIELPDVSMCQELDVIKIEQSLVVPAKSEGRGHATTSLISVTTRDKGLWQRRRYHQCRRA